jgi:hypothetical protein
MSSEPYTVFVNEEDHWSWDKYIEKCDLIELSDDDRRRAKDSYQYLRGALGEGYLKGNCVFDKP